MPYARGQRAQLKHGLPCTYRGKLRPETNKPERMQTSIRRRTPPTQTHELKVPIRHCDAMIAAR